MSDATEHRQAPGGPLGIDADGRTVSAGARAGSDLERESRADPRTVLGVVDTEEVETQARAVGRCRRERSLRDLPPSTSTQSPIDGRLVLFGTAATECRLGCR